MDILAFPHRSDALRVAGVVHRYLGYLRVRHEAGNYSKSSYQRADHLLGNFLDHYGEQLVTDCRRSDLTRWLTHNPQWQSDFMKTDALAAVVRCFRWAADCEQLIAASPYRKPADLQLVLRPRPAITASEFRAIVRCARHRQGKRRRPSAWAFRCACHFLWRTGARTCEMREALWSQLDWTAGVITLEHHKTDRTGEDRLIGLDDGLLRMLRWLWQRRKPNTEPCTCPVAAHVGHAKGEHIFMGGHNTPWLRDRFSAQFRYYARQARVPATKTAYSLRHGFCVEAITKGIGERQIADQMGHTTTRYISWYGRQARQRAEHVRNVARQSRRRRSS